MLNYFPYGKNTKWIVPEESATGGTFPTPTHVYAYPWEKIEGENIFRGEKTMRCRGKNCWELTTQMPLGGVKKSGMRKNGSGSAYPGNWSTKYISPNELCGSKKYMNFYSYRLKWKKKKKKAYVVQSITFVCYPKLGA
ncbi:hypothetical protein POVCU2_0022640 [Plasmodium ovale curtisi]|uniref:Uncharacterized protein n=1 Tax=Plasmodium ovale curtisi TaxID=864141 RepID=A0A1A8VTD5_PLAOA|nr:hypothetical protein POVCU2_0022640 [Plasmodium ovale curtisi]